MMNTALLPEHGMIMSWSGGKDSALALSRVVEFYGNRPYALLTMMIEDGSRSRSHGIRREILEAQAHALGLPIFFFSCSWGTYEEVFEKGLRIIQNSFENITFQAAAFGDICLKNDPNWNNHRTWADNVCARAGIKSIQPLWDESEESLLNDFFKKRFKALVVCEKIGIPPLFEHSSLTHPQFLGRPFTHDLAHSFNTVGISPCGERGEFHTFVFDGPIFQHPLNITIHPHTIHQRSGYWHGEIELLPDF